MTTATLLFLLLSYQHIHFSTYLYLSSILSFRIPIFEPVHCLSPQVCLLVVNMQETSRQVVNHLRIMIEEAEMLSPQQTKLFVMLLQAKYFTVH